MPRRSRGVESRRHPVEHARRAIVRDEVEVAIICSLPLEANAVLALFDDHWDEGPPGLTDAYSYSFGTLGGHHVVLAHPSGIGKAKAANAAATCASSFRNIRLALVVGICGGAPAAENKEEILLGDVVISSGIIQYDFGRQFPDHFRPKNTLKEPNARVGSLLAKLKTDFHRKALQGKVSEALAQSGASYPGNGDVLFQSSYRCDNAHQVARRRGNVKHEPAVHVGIVASGDSVIKSGKHRDNIIHETQAIAFEMEGAGVWDNFDCVIVVKGVCDYADSHKNKLWQGYAADTAAACTRALLQFWRGRPVR
ncbi:nucleoside phosphorylase domain-containing protein [Aspergillus carlsbadensis]|nr:nucleoside phosphorylase domain-containing protein [Aspergillus carlsbadensis]